MEKPFGVVTSCANAFLPAYTTILEKNKDMKFTDDMKEWQQMRRGRYVG